MSSQYPPSSPAQLHTDHHYHRKPAIGDNHHPVKALQLLSDDSIGASSDKLHDLYPTPNPSSSTGIAVNSDANAIHGFSSKNSPGDMTNSEINDRFDANAINSSPQLHIKDTSDPEDDADNHNDIMMSLNPVSERNRAQIMNRNSSFCTTVDIPIDSNSSAHFILGRKRSVCNILLPTLKNISRQHSFISYNDTTKQLKITCSGTNGLVVLFPVEIDCYLTQLSNEKDPEKIYQLIYNVPDTIQQGSPDVILSRYQHLSSFALLKNETVLMPLINETILDFRQATAVIKVDHTSASDLDNFTETEDEMIAMTTNSDDFQHSRSTSTPSKVLVPVSTKSPNTDLIPTINQYSSPQKYQDGNNDTLVEKLTRTPTVLDSVKVNPVTPVKQKFHNFQEYMDSKKKSNNTYPQSVLDGSPSSSKPKHADLGKQKCTMPSKTNGNDHSKLVFIGMNNTKINLADENREDNNNGNNNSKIKPFNIFNDVSSELKLSSAKNASPVNAFLPTIHDKRTSDDLSTSSAYKRFKVSEFATTKNKCSNDTRQIPPLEKMSLLPLSKPLTLKPIKEINSTPVEKTKTISAPTLEKDLQTFNFITPVDQFLNSEVNKENINTIPNRLNDYGSQPTFRVTEIKNKNSSITTNSTSSSIRKILTPINEEPNNLSGRSDISAKAKLFIRAQDTKTTKCTKRKPTNSVTSNNNEVNEVGNQQARVDKQKLLKPIQNELNVKSNSKVSGKGESKSFNTINLKQYLNAKSISEDENDLFEQKVKLNSYKKMKRSDAEKIRSENEDTPIEKKSDKFMEKNHTNALNKNISTMDGNAESLTDKTNVKKEQVNTGSKLQEKKIIEENTQNNIKANDSNDKYSKFEVENAIINYLAYAKVQQVPFSELFNVNGTTASFSEQQLTTVLNGIKCIGVITRHGKDAAGKPLEKEYYYDIESDDDVDRKSIVQLLKGGRSGLRSCRKTHKQYFWKKPALKKK